MPAKKYTPQQQAELDLLTAVHLEKVKAKAVLRATIEAQLADALNDLSIKESQQANRALDAKITKTDIGRALGTANWQTIEAILARTAGDLTASDFDPLNERYSVEGDQIRVTLTADEARDVLKNFGQQYTSGMPLSALFGLHGSAWVFEGDGWLAEFGCEHPVSLWSHDEGNRVELAEWAGERP